MRRLMLTSLIALGLLLALSLSPQEVFACAGGGGRGFMPLKGMVETADVIVEGHFVELDEAQANGIFHVERYLVGGSGPTSLMLAMNDVNIVRRRLHGITGDGYDCSYILADFEVGRSMTIFLRRNINGSYVPTPAGTTYFNFLDSDTTNILETTGYGGQEQKVAFQEFTQSQLEEFLSSSFKNPRLLQSQDTHTRVNHPY